MPESELDTEEEGYREKATQQRLRESREIERRMKIVSYTNGSGIDYESGIAKNGYYEHAVGKHCAMEESL